VQVPAAFCCIQTQSGIDGGQRSTLIASCLELQLEPDIGRLVLVIWLRKKLISAVGDE